MVWFQGVRFVESKYKLNKEYIVFGNPLSLGINNIAHPDIEECKTPIDPVCLPINTTEKMKRSYNSKTFNKLMEGAFSMLKSLFQNHFHLTYLKLQI